MLPALHCCGALITTHVSKTRVGIQTDSDFAATRADYEAPQGCGLISFKHFAVILYGLLDFLC